MWRFSEQNVQQKWTCPMSENPALLREQMDVVKMWKLKIKTGVWLKLMLFVYLVISHAHIDQL